MTCKATNAPPPAEIDIPAMQEKYRQERDKRKNRAGQKQYLRSEGGEFVETYESDPHMPVAPRDPISEEIDVVVRGAGLSGLMAGVQLKKAGGTSVRTIDHCGDFGGVWYRNRYPGVQCDNDAYCYLPMLEEMGYLPSKKFADDLEIYEYCQNIATRFDLYERALFHTLVKGMRWVESIQRWRLTTDRGDDIRARVAIIGTGATALQAIPYLGKYAKELYVSQRTPSTVDQRFNSPTDPEWAKSLHPGWQGERQSNFNRPNVKLIDVSATKGVECMTEKGFIAHGVEYEIDCMLFASGFEVTSDLDRRWGFDTFEGRNGLSIYKHWADGYKTLHGMMTTGFPNQFFIGYYQGGINATTTEQYGRQAHHIAYIVKEALARGASSVEPSSEAQDAWVKHIRETAIDITSFERECTPSYYNNEGETVNDADGKEKYRYFLGEVYGPGWQAFEQILQNWRDEGKLAGLVVEKGAPANACSRENP